MPLSRGTGNGPHGDKGDDPAEESTHTSKKGEGSSFPHTGTFVAPCYSSDIAFRHSPGHPVPAHSVSMEWSFCLLMEEHSGLFPAGMLEKQEDHQLGL